MEDWTVFIKKQRLKKLVFLPNEVVSFLMSLTIKNMQKEYPLEMVNLLLFDIEIEDEALLITRWGIYFPKDNIEKYHWYIEKGEEKRKLERYFSLNSVQLDVVNHVMIEYYEKGVH